MWIRDYDGDLMVNCDLVESFYCEKDKNNSSRYQLTAYINNGECVLQRGMTKDAAMELLTQIQDCFLNNRTNLDLMPDSKN